MTTDMRSEIYDRATTDSVKRGPRIETRTQRIARLAVVVAMLAGGLVLATPGTAGAQVPPPPGCEFSQPDHYPLNYQVSVTRSGNLSPDWFAPLCSGVGSVSTGDVLRVYQERYGMLYVQNLNTQTWGWYPSALVSAPITHILDRSASSSSGERSVFTAGQSFEKNTTAQTGERSVFTRGQPSDQNSTTQTGERGIFQATPSIASANTNTGSIQPATATATASNSVTCSWFQPTSYVPNYVLSAGKDAAVKSRNHHTCKTISTIKRGDQVKVHSELGDYRFIENLTQAKWGWVHKSVFDGASSSTQAAPPSSSCDWVQPSSYVSNYTAYGRTTYMMRPQPNTNCPTDNKIYANDRVTVHAHSGDWRFIENHTRGTWGWVRQDGFR